MNRPKIPFWLACNDGHTELWSIYDGTPLIIAHLDRWPIGEIADWYNEKHASC